MKKLSILFIGFGIFFSSCDSVFRSDPFSGPVPEHLSDLNTKAAGAFLKQIETDSNSLRIALISDSHYGLDELQKAIHDIVLSDSIDLIVHCGDLTQSGLYDEYKASASILAISPVPTITLIGNHDHLALGRDLFAAFFGPSNLVLEHRGRRLIFWDNTVWESFESNPNTQWLREQLETADSASIVFSHIPPWSDQMSESFGNLYHTLMLENTALISVHGHNHQPSYGYPLGQELPYLVVGSTLEGYWQELIIHSDSIKVIQHEF